MTTLTWPQRAAMNRLDKSEIGHESIRYTIANALVRRGLAEWVHHRGNIRLTDAGRAWNAAP